MFLEVAVVCNQETNCLELSTFFRSLFVVFLEKAAEEQESEESGEEEGEEEGTESDLVRFIYSPQSLRCKYHLLHKEMLVCISSL